jgi:hypothetical protein
MSLLQQNNGLHKVIENALAESLDPWLNNVPDFYDMHDAYKKLGKLKAAIKRKKRDIERVEDTIAAETDKPRSNDARINRINATSTLRDELAEIEAQYEEIEALVKAMEFHRAMFSSAMYRTKMEL